MAVLIRIGMVFEAICTCRVGMRMKLRATMQVITPAGRKSISPGILWLTAIAKPSFWFFLTEKDRKHPLMERGAVSIHDVFCNRFAHLVVGPKSAKCVDFAMGSNLF